MVGPAGMRVQMQPVVCEHRRGRAYHVHACMRICVPKGAAAQGGPDAGGAGAASHERA